tara:strand:- start:3 stop:518 length:516 start_codon:yes stop_codon:yes gene_type:complete
MIFEVNHKASILVGDYQFSDSLNREVIEQLKYAKDIGTTNVRASKHTVWDWLPENKKFNNFKSFILNETEKHFTPGKLIDGKRNKVKCSNFWANVYLKGDDAQAHDHRPHKFSFAYFVKSKWYDSPLIFTNSGKRIRPKEGRYVIFPSYLMHHVPKHRYKHSRITLSGNFI